MSAMTPLHRVAESQAKYDGRSLIGMPRVERERYIERARLAVEAMREPSAVMLEAPLRYEPRDVFHTNLGTIDARKKYESRRDLRPLIFRAMIDAALGEQP